MNSEDARLYFKSKGLTYSVLTQQNIQGLFNLLDQHVKWANKNDEMSVKTMRMSKKIKSKQNEIGVVENCYFFINSHYFIQREAVSFNTDGVIGFAGWADGANTKPLIEAFIEWVDVVASSGTLKTRIAT